MKRSTKCLITAALALLLVPFGVGLLCAKADDVTGQQVLDDTRYSAVGFDFVNMIIDTIDDIHNQELPESLNPLLKNSLKLFAQKAAEQITKDTIDSANKTWENAPNYTVQAAFCIMGKRKILYPNGENEVQTVICYINKNVSEAMPQQFGEYTIAPNTIFFVRQTSWNGVIPISIPIAENNIQYFTYNADYAFEIWLNAPSEQTFVYDTPNGRETYGYRHSSAKIHFINNTVNSIVRTDFVDAYEDSPSNYSAFFPNDYADNITAFMGNGYIYERSSPFMLNDCMPFYVTTAFFNSDWEFGDKTYNYYNTDPDNIDPSKPPAYVIPNDNPLFHGKTINNNTINNYNDYGITEIDGQLSIDPDILAGALGGLINPDFNCVLGGVFGAQPQIGLNFDTPLDLNLPEIFDDFIDSITVYPPSTRPQVPTVTTFSEWDYLPSYTIQTFPVDLQDAAHVLSDNITGFTDSMGITSILLILALIGLMTYCIF